MNAFANMPGSADQGDLRPLSSVELDRDALRGQTLELAVALEVHAHGERGAERRDRDLAHAVAGPVGPPVRDDDDLPPGLARPELLLDRALIRHADGELPAHVGPASRDDREGRDDREDGDESDDTEVVGEGTGVHGFSPKLSAGIPRRTEPRIFPWLAKTNDSPFTRSGHFKGSTISFFNETI